MIRLFVLLTIVGAVALHAPARASEEKKEGEEVACVEAPAEGEAKKEEGGEHGSKDAPTCPKGPQYVPVGVLNVPVLNNGKISQQVTIEIMLETPDYKMAAEVKKKIPILRDAYLSRLYSAFAVGSGLNNGIVDIERLRSRVSDANAKLLPEGMVSKVLLQTVVQRMN